MNSSKAKDFKFDNMVSEWGGYVSSIDRTKVAENIMVRGSLNVYKRISGKIAVRQGLKRLGEANSTESRCYSEFVWNTSWGATYVLVVSNDNLYVVIDNVWYSLLSGLTQTRYVFDNWFDNTEKKDRVLFVNGTANMYHWSGGYATVASTTVNTITKTGSTSWQQSGFSTTSGEKTLVIDGVTYTYTGGESTLTLTGVTPDPSAVTASSVALQAVQTSSNTPASGFNSDFIKVINNQVYVGSYTSRLCYISSSTDFKDYTVPTPRAPGDPELLTLDGTLNGIGVRQGKAHIGVGNGAWAIVSFSDITVGTDLTQTTTVTVKPVASLQAPFAHEFISSVGDNLIYLAKDQQVRSFGDFNNLFATGYPSLSQEIATEIAQEDFDGGGLKCIGEFIYLTAPVSGKVYLKQERTTVNVEGTIIAERIWHAPFILNASFIDEIDGVVVAFSNANPQIYQVWDTDQWYDDSPSEEQLPYSCVLALGYRGQTRRQGLWSFDKQFTEGFISEGTPLYLTINYNYQGSTSVVTVPVNTISNPAHIFAQDLSSLGDSSLGEQSLGNGGILIVGNDDDSLPKFKVINSLPLINCFEWQPIYFSESANANWEILAVATNADVVYNQDATFIVNKRSLA